MGMYNPGKMILIGSLVQKCPPEQARGVRFCWANGVFLLKVAMGNQSMRSSGTVQLVCECCLNKRTGRTAAGIVLSRKRMTHIIWGLE